MIRAVAVAALLMSASAPVLAQSPPGYSPKYVDCQARAHGNTVQEGLCAQSEVVAQDDRLNKAYQQVMRQLSADPVRRTALRARQRSWLKQRDYDCKINGTTIDAGCIVEKTASRANELEADVRF